MNAPTACQVLAAVAITITANGCSRIPDSTTDKDASYAQRNLGETPLGQLAKELAVGRNGVESGFLLLDRGHDALAWRLALNLAKPLPTAS